MSNAVQKLPQNYHEDDSVEHDETLADKLNDLLSSPDSTENSSAVDPDENSDEDILQMDENGRIKDFDMIADVLETKRCENKTFNDYELRDIERKNSILMNKILSSSRRPSQYTTTPIAKKESSSSINRRQKQAQIDRVNMILLKKIQSVKPFGQSWNKKS